MKYKPQGFVALPHTCWDVYCQTKQEINVEGMEEIGPWHTADGNVKWGGCYRI